MNLKWLIYCRVSSAKQVKEWNGLSSQEKRCRDYAVNTLWIEIEKVFNDEWVSWWVFERKSITKLFNYIDAHKTNNYTVIFEDLNRLSRDIQVHNLLRNEFKKKWVELACPNFLFEESPEWAFRENMSVSMAQYEKDKNKQRVNDRMRARLEQWFWCFKVPIWYKYSTNAQWWKEILFDKNHKIIRKALIHFSDNRLKTINDVARFLDSKWIKLGNIQNGKVYNANKVSRMLRNILYTGYLEFPKWDIRKTKAKHQAIIDIATYEKILSKLDTKAKVLDKSIESNSNRVDKTNDFPLRWFLYCEESKQMISGAWSQWKTKKFPYYVFPRKSSLHWKSLNRDAFHSVFEKHLEDIQPKEELIATFLKIIERAKEKNEVKHKEHTEVLKKEISKIDNKIQKYIERIGETKSDTLIENYEKQIQTLEDEKLEKKEKLTHTNTSVWTPLKKKIELVRNSLDIWNSGDLGRKKRLIWNIFPQWIPINKNKQVWTPTYSLIYQSFSIWERSYLDLVEPSEPC